MARKYQLTKIGKGDWILPNNEGTYLFRISQERHGWSVRRYDTAVSRMGDDLPDDFLEGRRWEPVSDTHRTRDEAVATITGPKEEKFTGPRLQTDRHGRTTLRLW